MKKKPRQHSRTRANSRISHAYRDPSRGEESRVVGIAGKSLQVLYEDNHCLAVLKPAGMLTTPDRTGDVSLLDLARQYIRAKCQKPGNVYLGLVHRLDRPVSGVVLFARTSKAAARLSEQFRSGAIRKRYIAWVEGAPEPSGGELSDYLTKDRQRNEAGRAIEQTAGARRAVLEYKVIERLGSCTHLEIRPHTGRPHQIRVQLGSRGLPIIGDVKYGARRAHPGRIALHAAELVFEHPVRHEPVTVSAPQPAEWKRWFVAGL